MRHVTWDVGERGPGVDAVREFLREYHALAIRKGDFGIPPTGAIDASLKQQIGTFQKQFNYLASINHAMVAKVRKKLSKTPIIETGVVDYNTRVIMGIKEELAKDDSIQLPAGVAAKQSDLSGHEFAAAQPGTLVGKPYRVADLAKLLTAIGLKDAKVGTVSDKRIAPLPDGRLMVHKGHALYDDAKDKSECAALVQSFGVPETNQWRRGPRVQDVAIIEPGTVVATLGTGVYLSDYSGQSHVGIFLSKDAAGFAILDQFNGDDGNLGIRYKRFGTAHKMSPVKAERYLDPGHSHRMPVKDDKGTVIGYGRDYSLQTTKYRSNLTSDGSEYYVLLSDGTVARKDLDVVKRSTARELATEVVNYLFGGVDQTMPKDWAKEWKAAADQLQPVAPRDDTLKPR